MYTDVNKLLAFEASDNLYPILHERYCFIIDRVDEKPLMQSFSNIVFRFQHNFNCPKFCRVSLYETRCFGVGIEYLNGFESFHRSHLAEPS